MPYVLSTLSQDNEYVTYDTSKIKNNLHTKVSGVVIHGGANVLNRMTMITERGVVTKVTDEQLKQLLANPMFQRHKKRGFVTIVKGDLDAEQKDKIVKSDMEGKDGSAQLTAGDFKKQGKKAPKTIGSTK